MADEPGGKGGRITPNLVINQTSDTRLIEKAINQRWDIPEGVRSEVPAAMREIVNTAKSHRNKIAASRVLLQADGLNMAQEARDAGGETVNVLVGAMTDDERERRIAELVARGHSRCPALPDIGGTGGTGPADPAGLQGGMGTMSE